MAVCFIGDLRREECSKYTSDGSVFDWRFKEGGM
jgi:hypothetical protein